MVSAAACGRLAAGRSWRAAAEKVVFDWRFKIYYAQS